MNFQRLSKLIAILFAICLIAPALVMAEPAKEQKEGDRPDDSYLAKFHAVDRVEKLSRTNREKIYMLFIIKENFGDADWATKYDELNKQFEEGMAAYYQQEIIDAQSKLVENEKQLNATMQKISDTYIERCKKLLSDGTKLILKKDMDRKTHKDNDEREKLQRNQLRLKIAYGQLADGRVSKMKHNYESAISHLRVCKAYAIQILEDLDPEAAKKIEKIDEDKADNLGRNIKDSGKAKEADKKAEPAK